MMEKEKLEKEISKYKNSSNLKIKFVIFIYKIFGFINQKNFYFIISLFVTLLFSYLINFSLIGALISHIIVWFFLKDKILKEEVLKNEKEEIDYIINKLKSYLKSKIN